MFLTLELETTSRKSLLKLYSLISLIIVKVQKRGFANCNCVNNVNLRSERQVVVKVN